MQSDSEKSRRSKGREVSSRFLSATSNSSTTGGGIPSPTRITSPSHQLKNGSVSNQKQHRRSAAHEIASIRGALWPSSTSVSSSSPSGTLADHLGNERLIDFIEGKDATKKSIFLLSRQKSSSVFNRIENENENVKDREKESSKENRPIGGSMRYTGNFKIPVVFPSSRSLTLTPGRVTADDTGALRKPPRRKSDALPDFPSSDSERSEIFRGTDLGSPSLGRRRSNADASIRFLSRIGKGSDSSEVSSNLDNSAAKIAMKRTNSITTYGSSSSQWALSPGRAISPPIAGENNGKRIHSFSSLRPRGSKTKGGMGNIISLGLELLTGKKHSSSVSSPTGFGVGEIPHQVRLLHNRLQQWRFVNAKTESVNRSRMVLAENTVMNAWLNISKLQSSVVEKRVQLEKRKLEMKLNSILNSQVKPLELWAEMERQHLSAVSMTGERLHAVVCRVPLAEGAKAESQPISVALSHAADLTESINSTIGNFSLMAQKNGPILSELAEVTIREKSLLQECFELLGVFTNLELQERSLRCQIIQMKSDYQQQLQAM